MLTNRGRQLLDYATTRRQTSRRASQALRENRQRLSVCTHRRPADHRLDARRAAANLAQRLNHRLRFCVDSWPARSSEWLADGGEPAMHHLPERWRGDPVGS